MRIIKNLVHTCKKVGGRVLQSETFGLLSYSYKLGSRFFTGVLIFIGASSLIAGNFDIDFLYPMLSILFIASCAIVVFVNRKIKAKLRIKICISFGLMIALGILFSLFYVCLFDEVMVIVFINVFTMLLLMKCTVWLFDETKQEIEKSKSKKDLP